MRNFAVALIAVGILFLLCLASAGNAVEGDTGKRVIVIISHDAAPYQEVFEAFKSSLAGSSPNIRYTVHRLEADAPETENTLRQTLERDFDLCLALGSRAAELAASHFTKLPVLAGMVLKYATPPSGNPNFGGVWLDFPVAGQLKLLREVLPASKILGVVYNPLKSRHFVEEAIGAAAAYGLTVNAVEVNSPRELPAALDSISRRADVIWGVPDSTVMNPQTARDIILFSFRRSIPLVGISPLWVKSGALYSAAWDFGGMGNQLGRKAANLLGEDPGGLPSWSYPEKMFYVINKNTARSMKLDIPDTVSFQVLTQY